MAAGTLSGVHSGVTWRVTWGRFFKHSRQYLGHLPAAEENVNIFPQPLHFLVILWSGAFILHSWQRSGQY